jgi:ribonuclease D
LRDDRDDLNFEELNGESLANVDPPSALDGEQKYLLVDSADKMEQCIHELTEAKPSEIAFDVECYNVSKYTQLTCLLQVTSNVGKEYVIDTLAPGVWDKVHGLAPLFADPSIVKIGHSLGGLDARSLHRDFGIFLVNAFDTYEASRELGLDSHGLVAVCQYYGMSDAETYSQLKSKYQTGDWRVRPLTEPMIQYARYDIRYLIKLRWLMLRDLVRSEVWQKDAAERRTEDQRVADSLAVTLAQIQRAEDDVDFSDNEGDEDSFTTSVQPDSGDGLFFTPNESFSSLPTSERNGDFEVEGVPGVIRAEGLRLQPRLMRCISLSQDRCRDVWPSQPEPHLKNSLFLSLVQRSKFEDVGWTEDSTRLYDALFQWRERVAEDSEILPGFVVPLQFLVEVAWKRPMTESTLRQISYRFPALLNEHAKVREELLVIVLRHSLEGSGMVGSEPVYLYSKLKTKVRAVSAEEETDSRRRGIHSTTIVKAALVLTVCAGAVFVALAVRRRRKHY